MKKLIPIFLLFSNIIFASDFEINFGLSSGYSVIFNEVKQAGNVGLGYQYGMRIGDGTTINALISTGRNYKIPNEKLTSISALFETGYNFYIRYRNYDLNNKDRTEEYMYHSIILGVLAKFNFYNNISFGVGGGIFFPLYSKTNIKDISLGVYQNTTKFPYHKIVYMHKVPIMPYIKFNVERYFYFTKKWAFTIGLNLIYNFGMEFNMDRLKNENKAKDEYQGYSGTYYGYEKYKFSSLAAELVFSISFGRPK